jgi:hypothetical protein
MTRVWSKAVLYLNLILGPIPQPLEIGCFAPDYCDPPITTQFTLVPIGTGWMTGSVCGLLSIYHWKTEPIFILGA